MANPRHPATRVVASSLLTQVALVISGPLAVRLLGVEDRGEAAFVFAGVLLISQVGPWGLPQSWSYFIARGDVGAPTLIRLHLRRYLVQSLLVAALGTGAAAAVAVFTDSLTYPLAETMLVGGGIFSIMLAVLALGCLQGAQQFNALAIVQAIPGVGYACAVVILTAIGHASIVVILVFNMAGWLVVGVLGLWLAWRLPAAASASPPPPDKIRRYGRRALVTVTAPIDNLGIDLLAVGLLLSYHALGLYVVGLAFETGPVLVLVALASVCTPVVASIDDPAIRRAYCRRWLVIGSGLGLAAVAAIQLIIDPVLPLAFGQDAAAALPTARILVVAGLFLGLRRLAAGMLQGAGRPTEATYAEMAGLVGMLVAMLPLTQLWGVEGACLALLLGGFVTFTTDVVMLFGRKSVQASTASLAPSLPM